MNTAQLSKFNDANLVFFALIPKILVSVSFFVDIVCKLPLVNLDYYNGVRARQL